MLAVIGCLVLIVIVLSGLGVLIGGRQHAGDVSFGAYAVIGLVPLTAAGLIANFLTPLTHELALAAAATGVASFALRARLLWASLGSRPHLMLSVLATLLVAAAVGAVVTPPAYDTGLYHLQAIKWLEQSVKVFGLANLHLRFGVNSTWFTDAAMLDLPGVGRAMIFLLNPALFVAVLAALLQPALDWRPSAGRQRLSNVVAALAAVVLLVNAKLLSFHSIGASPSYDLPSALLTMVAFWAFIKMHELEIVGAATAVRAQFILVLTAAILAVAIKLSAAPILLLLPAALFSLRRSGHVPLSRLLRDPVAGGLGVLGAVWLAGGIASSGCVVFPAPATCLTGLPWSVPLERVHYMADIVAGWARMPGDHFAEALHGWAWLKSWPFTVVAHRAFVAGTAATVAALALLIAAFAIHGHRAGLPSVPAGSRTEAFAIAYAAATGIVGIVFWFATAPDPRFGMGFLVATPVLLLAWAAWRWLPEAGPAQRAWAGDTIAGLVFLFGIVVVAVFGMAALARARSWPDIPVPTVQDAALGPRFHANVPVGTDQCWDAPLPCAPDFRSPSLRGSHVVIWRSIESGAADR